MLSELTQSWRCQQRKQLNGCCGWHSIQAAQRDPARRLRDRELLALGVGGQTGKRGAERHYTCRSNAANRRFAAIMIAPAVSHPCDAGASPSPEAAGEVGRVAREVLHRSSRCRGARDAPAAAITRVARRDLRRPWPAASRERHCACSLRGDRDAPAAARTCTARRGPSAGRGRPRRTSGTARARLAAIVATPRRFPSAPQLRRSPGRACLAAA